MKSNIVLIGMPGAGKTTIGRKLAEKLHMFSIDGDAIMEEAEGMKLQEIINTKGLDYFLSLEGKVLSTVNYRNYVISPGGSAVYYPEAMAHLSEIADIVYLQANADVLRTRIGDTMYTRGIAFEPNETFEDLYNKRIPLYEKYAEVTINTDHQDTEKTVNDILKALNI